jgi:hypothetical protein
MAPKYKSVAARPGYGKGRVPFNKGLELPAEELSEREVEALLSAYGGKPEEVRDRAIIALLYRVGMKPEHIRKLDRRHYQPGADTIKFPELKRIKGGEVRLDSVTQSALERWIEVRRTLATSSITPWFCLVKENPGRPITEWSTVRASMRRRAKRVGIEARVTPEGLRLSGERHLRSRAPGALESHLDEDWLRERHPDAYAKWRDAQALFFLDPKRHATRIGHDCREAMILFASALSARHDVASEKPPAATVDRIRSVLDASLVGLGATTDSFMTALLAYWGTVSDLAQRQEHGASREREALTAEDSRRLILQTLVVMHEVEHATLFAAPKPVATHPRSRTRSTTPDSVASQLF